MQSRSRRSRRKHGGAARSESWLGRYSDAVYRHLPAQMLA